ncbi:MAG: menaquinone reductase multiheme cytochrome c subunit QrcA [Desulfobacterales bacterium]|nr:menaquinone reductase multiheme cytochrome c subunit QrcA [Desulfobacterales bacterium]
MGTNEKANEVSTETAENESITPSDGIPTEEQDAGAGGPIILFFIFGLVVSLVVGWVVFPKLLYSSKKQPFDYNHALHNELVDEGCESCHFFRDDGSYAGVPTLAQCIDCHEEVNGESEDERIFVEEYVAKDREVPWLIYSRQPDCVFFSHAAHVKMGNMDCVTCHGHIGESESLRVYRENRISGYSIDIWGENIAGIKRNSWDRMKMDDCSECHQRENVNQNSVQTLKGGCFVCHH